MKILVISDTHKKLNNAINLIDRVTDLDLVIHLGDHYRDAEDLQAIYNELNFEYVAGNCDFASENGLKERLLEINGKKILLTHGHYYQVKYGYNLVAGLLEEKKVDVVLFGHTHLPVIEYIGDKIIMNPGSTSEPRRGNLPSYAILEIDERGRIHPTINFIGKKN